MEAQGAVSEVEEHGTSPEAGAAEEQKAWEVEVHAGGERMASEEQKALEMEVQGVVSEVEEHGSNLEAGTPDRREASPATLERTPPKVQRAASNAGPAQSPKGRKKGKAKPRGAHRPSESSAAEDVIRQDKAKTRGAPRSSESSVAEDAIRRAASRALDVAPAAADSPVEQDLEIPEELIAHFALEEVNDLGGDVFNDLGRNFPRDNTNRVQDNDALLARVNDYSYSIPPAAMCRAWAYTMCTMGLYYYKKRRTIPAGHFGHYVSMERHMLKPAGRHILFSDEEEWLDIIPIDDENATIREIGTKALIVVPENHVAGAFRIGGLEQDGGQASGEEDANQAGDPSARDGDFVLFGQGRHVLDSSRYREVVIKKLDSNQVELGPVTVLYIKEGFIGGAYERTTGQYRVFQPGPPYLLHEKDFEGIELTERKLAGFNLGPIHFVTVKDGEVGGAFHKVSGSYQLLPPGNTYKLHEKDYESVEKKTRTDWFELGPYTFLTVQLGYIAGAYKQKGGDFVIFPPGSTYQLNENDYREPQRVRRDKHVVQCGPLTFLTLQEGALMGAYRTRDGKFEEFSYHGKNASQFELHERDYHGLVVVNKYSKEVQEFGPNRIVTIPEGECGVFEREGCLEIKEAGFYKVSSDYAIRSNIPLYVKSERFDDKEFRTKDSVLMRIVVQLVWRVDDPLTTAKWPGTLVELQNEFRSKALACLVMLLRAYPRSDLLPTRQDVLLAEGVDLDHADVEKAVKEAQAASKQVQEDTELKCLEMMNLAAADGGWGIAVVKVNIDSLELADEQILKDMEAIAQTQLATKRKQMEGQAARVAANLEREAAMHSAKAKAEVQQQSAESDAQVKMAEARAASEISLMEAKGTAKAQAEAKKIELEMQLQLEESQAALEEAKATRAAKAEAEAKKIELEMQRQMAESQVSIEETKLRAQRLQAETEAASIRAMAEANYEKGRQEQEVASMMPQQEYELRRLQLVVEGMRHFSQAAWRHPEDAQRAHLHLFWEEMKPFMRLAPMGAADMHAVQQQAMAGHVAATRAAAASTVAASRRRSLTETASGGKDTE